MSDLLGPESTAKILNKYLLVTNILMGILVLELFYVALGTSQLDDVNDNISRVADATEAYVIMTVREKEGL